MCRSTTVTDPHTVIRWGGQFRDRSTRSGAIHGPRTGEYTADIHIKKTGEDIEVGSFTRSLAKPAATRETYALNRSSLTARLVATIACP